MYGTYGRTRLWQCTITGTVISSWALISIDKTSLVTESLGNTNFTFVHAVRLQQKNIYIIFDVNLELKRIITITNYFYRVGVQCRYFS